MEVSEMDLALNLLIYLQQRYAPRTLSAVRLDRSRGMSCLLLVCAVAVGLLADRGLKLEGVVVQMREEEEEASLCWLWRCEDC